MPLIEGYSEESIHENIKREIASGKSRKQAVAIAYAKAKEAKRKQDDCSVLLNPGFNERRNKETGEFFV